MENSDPEPTAARFLQRSKRDWQLLLIGVLAAATLGLGAALFGLLRAGPEAWDLRDYAALVPPLLFGFVSVVLLTALWVAQRQGVMAALQQQIVHLKMEAELNKELALLDPITEVYNRRYLRSLLLKEVGRAKRTSQPLSVIVFEVLGFRRVSESLGLTGADVVLRQIAQMVQQLIRNSDYVIRYGGHEFLLLLPDTTEEAAGQLGERIRRALTEWSEKRGMSEFELTIAAGTGAFLGDQPVEDVIKLADNRMRAARETPSRGHPVPGPDRIRA
jgi:diguanylate cyclase (GGDEF)-like protein